jgi:eukaryotic-like serine/threonine-protein kinase
MSQHPRKPDLTETSPMDSKARADAERDGRIDVEQDSPGQPGTQAQAGGGISGKTKTKGGTNIDTIIGKIVVDQGLATPEEVQACLEQARTTSLDGNSKSLPLLLVENDFITKRQLERIKAQAEAERSGQQIPGYKVLGNLGKGAMATVFKAKQLSLDREVAIKVLPRKFTNNPQFIERFYAEGRAAAALNHPNIVQAFDVGQAGDYHYFVMEYVEGRTVYDDIVKHKRYNEADAIDIIIQVAEALQHAHSKGLIHRDVKPKNIMLSKEGVAKLADMGLARAMSDKEAAEAEQGKAFGTPYYISPEQIRGEKDVGPPSDIYSLGATLYHMVTGAVPFDGKNPSAVMHKHLKAELVAPDHANPRLSAGISEVIEMMMAKAPKDRYQTCSDLLVDLRAVRNKQNPPIAHKDIGGLDLEHLAQAEAAAPSTVVDQSLRQRTVAVRPVFIKLLIGALAVSVLGNILLLILKVAA